MKNIRSWSAGLLLSLTPIIGQAKSVNEATARSAGSNFLRQQGVKGVISENDLILSYSPSMAVGTTTVKDFYIFNISGRPGFVLVTADDLLMPVLAYSDEASFHYDQIAPAAKDWIDNYRKQVEYVIAHNTERPGAAEAWKALMTPVKPAAAKTTSVSPLITTTWDQTTFYNSLCPGSGSSKAVTGCVATAMAQLMKFWNWPVMGDGMHTYTHATYGTLSANYGKTTYQWSSMPNSVTAANTAVATLMYHCGVSVNMNYGTAASGGSSAVVQTAISIGVNNTEYALKTYFHYKPTLKAIHRDGISWLMYPEASYTTAAWIAALKAELDAGRPMIYRGDDGSSGHAWVCDGYQSSNSYMHFNWGWSGAGPNGYYSVDDVAPPVLGAGGGSGNFNLRHAVIIGIQPDTFATYTDPIKMQSPISFATSIPVRFNKPFSFSAKILNSGTSAFAGEVCAQIYDGSALVGTVNTVSGLSIASGDSSAALTFSTTAMPRLVTKKYGVKLMYRKTGAGTWTPVGNNGNLHNYSALDIRNDTTLMMYDSITIVTSNPMVPAAYTKVSAVLWNRTSTPFSGTLKAQLTDVTSGAVYTIGTSTGVNIAAFDILMREFSTTSLTAPNATYALEILHQFNGTGNFYTCGSKDFQNPKLVKVGTGIGVMPVTSVPHDIFVYPNPAKDMFRVLFNDYKIDKIIIADISGKVVSELGVEAGLPLMDIPVSEFPAGVYIVQFVSGGETLTKKINLVK